MELPADPSDDSVDQRRTRIKLAKEKFLDRWREHAETLSPIRKQVVLNLINNKGLHIIGYRSEAFEQWKPRTRKELAVWNGNPYASEIHKEPFELYDEVEELRKRINDLETLLKPKI